MNVAIEDQAHYLPFLIDYGRAGVAPNDVVGRDEVQRSLQIQLRLGVQPAPRQGIRIAPGGALERASENGEWRNRRAVLEPALNLPVAQPQSECRVRVEGGAVRGETRSSELLLGALQDRLYLVFVLLADRARDAVDQLRPRYHWVG